MQLQLELLDHTVTWDTEFLTVASPPKANIPPIHIGLRQLANTPDPAQPLRKPALGGVEVED